MLRYVIIVIIVFVNYPVFCQTQFLDSHFTSDFYKNQWVGFNLYDPVENEELYNYQGDKYFIPASNTKIMTLYTGLKILPDSIPSLKYQILHDTLYIAGTGDPTTLEPFFKQRKVIDFLSNQKLPIAVYLDNFNDSKWAPGWSWEDYSEYFSAERSPFPLYGNIVTISSTLNVSPIYFQSLVKKEKHQYFRDFTNNLFYVSTPKTYEIPYITSQDLTLKLIESEINKKVYKTNTFPTGNSNILYSIPSDSLYRRMMLVSDNFLAEQILLMSSLYVNERMNSEVVINHILKKHLSKIPQEPRWVDGSGLSRYNNFSPKDFVYVLNEMYHDIAIERLLSFFPVGGVNGTLKNSYKAKSPYIFAKTGSMGQVFNLSGFIKTKTGRILIFSYMNNNFKHSNSSLKLQMKKIFEYIRDNY
ncbi:D-alanyl-D-alanine carboxypeptidase [Apibacter raozihei]|uniref:D-alanyl-D-alanine carboxypeptidase n=1 Tax=Apibacter raozihei TaxID=2500547 RepID=UPI000FE2E25D|nr:D-alanyl-D-alanine carboxypeptidase [Apibacter raozihei]